MEARQPRTASCRNLVAVSPQTEALSRWRRDGAPCATDPGPGNPGWPSYESAQPLIFMHKSGEVAVTAPRMRPGVRRGPGGLRSRGGGVLGTRPLAPSHRRRRALDSAAPRTIQGTEIRLGNRLGKPTRFSRPALGPALFPNPLPGSPRRRWILDLSNRLICEQARMRCASMASLFLLASLSFHCPGPEQPRLVCEQT